MNFEFVDGKFPLVNSFFSDFKYFSFVTNYCHKDINNHSTFRGPQSVDVFRRKPKTYKNMIVSKTEVQNQLTNKAGCKNNNKIRKQYESTLLQ